MLGPLFLWVTRSAPYNRLTGHRVRGIGHTVLTSPVLKVRPTAAFSPPMRPDVIVFTSAQGVRHHPLDPAYLDVPVFTVGDRTAEAAGRRGYRHLYSARGNLSDLQRLIVTTVPRPAYVVHFSAMEPAGDLVGYLNMSGYEADRYVVYETEPVEDEALVRAFQALPALDGIITHSAKGARRLAQIISGRRWHGIVFCISEACAAELREVPGLLVEVAARPTEQSLMNLLRFHAGRRGVPLCSTTHDLSRGAATAPTKRLLATGAPLFFANDNYPARDLKSRTALFDPSPDPDDPPPTAA